jgi:hypothetical protein
LLVGFDGCGGFSGANENTGLTVNMGWPASLAPEKKKPRRLPPEASVLVLRLLLDPVGSTEEDSTPLAYSGRKLSQAPKLFINGSCWLKYGFTA